MHVSIALAKVPELEINKILFNEERPIPPHRKLEQKIVWALFTHMRKAGWAIQAVNDGEEWVETDNPGVAMEVIFNLDEAWVRLKSIKADAHIAAMHTVFLVGGNGEDIITDWGFTDGDPDGFNAAMDAFLDKLGE